MKETGLFKELALFLLYLSGGLGIVELQIHLLMQNWWAFLVLFIGLFSLLLWSIFFWHLIDKRMEKQ